jgi:hypothetical protein
MTAEGPRIVDWTAPVGAPAGFDLARRHILFTEIAPELVHDPE